MAFELKTSKEYFSMIPLQRYYYFCGLMGHYKEVPPEESGKLREFLNDVARREDEPAVRSYARDLLRRLPVHESMSL